VKLWNIYRALRSSKSSGMGTVDGYPPWEDREGTSAREANTVLQQVLKQLVPWQKQPSR
jgi:hypothetical protein